MSEANKQTQNKIIIEGQMEKISKCFTPSSKITERIQQSSGKPEISDHESTSENRHVNLKVEQETRESREKYETNSNVMSRLNCVNSWKNFEKYHTLNLNFFRSFIKVLMGRRR